jgi:hypothetical protein
VKKETNIEIYMSGVHGKAVINGVEINGKTDQPQTLDMVVKILVRLGLDAEQIETLLVEEFTRLAKIEIASAIEKKEAWVNQ